MLLISYKSHPGYNLIVAANRDEFYNRPAVPANYWDENKNILAGRDLLAGGTWLGVTKKGRFAAVTNYRDMSKTEPLATTRGNLTREFLSSGISPELYGDKIVREAADYSGYNLIFGDGRELFYFSNRSGKLVKLTPGIYGLSNHLLDTPWPKVRKSKTSFKKILSNKNISEEELFKLLSDTSLPPDESLPDTGLSLEIERAVSPIFVKTPLYGTRSSTVIFWNKRDEIKFIEKSLDVSSNKWIASEYDFKIEGN